MSFNIEIKKDKILNRKCAKIILENVWENSCTFLI